MSEDRASPHTAVVLMNLGSTAAPTAPALRRFLREFLSDRRVVDLPRLLWYPILYGFILTFRPRKLTGKYASIWLTAKGSPMTGPAHDGETCAQDKSREPVYERFQSPLMVYTTRLAVKLETTLAALSSDDSGCHIVVRDAMTYGEYHHVDAVLDELHKTYPSIKNVVVLPLFAQYTSTTVATIFDTVFRYYGDPHRRCLPSLQLIRDYATNTTYIEAVGRSLLRHLQSFYSSSDTSRKDDSPSWLEALRAALPTLAIVVSFHSIPCRYAAEGDDYVARCEATMDALQHWLQGTLAAMEGKASQGTPDPWSLDGVLLHVYQSQFGKAPWLGPSLERTMAALPAPPTASHNPVDPSATTKAHSRNHSSSAPSAKEDLVRSMATFYATRQTFQDAWAAKPVRDCVVITPGFAVDCIETLVEVAEEARDTFLEHGGKRFAYVPCLNDSDDHARVLVSVLKESTRLPV